MEKNPSTSSANQNRVLRNPSRQPLRNEHYVTRVVITSPASRRRNFWGNRNLRGEKNLFLSRLWEWCFNLSHKISEQSLQNCVSRIQSTNSRKKVVLEKVCIFDFSPTSSSKFRVFCKEFFQQKYQISFLRDQKENLGVLFLGKLGFKLADSKQKKSCLLWKPLGRIIKIKSLVSTRSFWRTMFFDLNSKLFSDSQRKLFGCLTKIFPLVCQNCRQRVQRRFLKKKKKLEWKKNSPSISKFELLILELLIEQYRTGHQTALYVSRGTFRQNYCWEKIFSIISALSAEISGTSGRKLLDFFEKKVFSINFRLSGKDFWASGKISEELSKLQSPFQEEHFGKKLRRKKHHFPSFSRKKLGLLVGCSVMDVKNFQLRVQKEKFWGNRNLRRKNNLFLSRLLERCFQPFAQKFRAESSKLRFTYPVDQFEETSFSWKCLYLRFFRNSSRKL